MAQKGVLPKQVKAQNDNPPRFSRSDLSFAALLYCVTIAIYLPAMSGGLLWDDVGHVTGPALQSLHGLSQIWFDLGATQQYYPLLHSAFWLEHRLWGDAVFGYHFTNVSLHALSALLVVAIMRRLSLPGAWLGGFLFAVHPVGAESVAWISEQKNTLSTVFYLGSALCYLRFDRERRGSRYLPALVLYVLALLCKSVTATLPASLLVVLWWERGRLMWKQDVMPLVPWFVIGGASGALTAWVERTYIGAHGASFDLTFLQRVLLAGRVFWFYLAKLFWPSNLIFIYPHWNVDAGADWQYMFPIALVAAAGGLWVVSRRNSLPPEIRRGPLAGLLCFLAALVPALGFVNVYPFIYSYVADHFQYQACLGIIVPCAAGMAAGTTRLSGPFRRFAPLAAVLLVSTLGGLAWSQAAIYSDSETLYRETIARNPTCWMAYDNLGILLAGKSGHASEAAEQFEKALQVKPDYADARLNLGNVLIDMSGRQAEAIAAYREAVRLGPGAESYHIALASALSDIQGSSEEAAAEYKIALSLQPGDASAHSALGTVLSGISGRLTEGIAEGRRAVELDGTRAEWHFALANSLARAPDQLEAAISEYRTAVRLRPDYAEAHENLGAILLQAPGQTENAIGEFRAAVLARPHYAEAHYNLGTVLSDIPGRETEAIAEYEAALRDRPDYAEAHYNLGIALSDIPGRLPDAIAQFRAALQARPDYEPARQVLARLRVTR